MEAKASSPSSSSPLMSAHTVSGQKMDHDMTKTVEDIDDVRLIKNADVEELIMSNVETFEEKKPQSPSEPKPPKTESEILAELDEEIVAHRARHLHPGYLDPALAWEIDRYIMEMREANEARAREPRPPLPSGLVPARGPSTRVFAGAQQWHDSDDPMYAKMVDTLRGHLNEAEENEEKKKKKKEQAN